jgi:hypothetical protein
MVALNGTKASSFLKMSPRTTGRNRELSGKLKNAAYLAQHGAPKCRIARPLGFVPKTVHLIGIEHLVGRRRTGEGLRSATSLAGAGCSRMLAAIAGTPFNREFHHGEAGPWGQRGLCRGLDFRSRTGFSLVWAISVVNGLAVVLVRFARVW